MSRILVIKIHQSDHVSICVDTMYQHDIYLFTLLLLPFSLYLLYHLDRVPDQDSGARTWPWLYLSCTKSWSSPDLSYRQLHQKGVDRMCSCCHGKGKTSLCAAPRCLSAELPQGETSQIVWDQKLLFFFYISHYSTILAELHQVLTFLSSVQCSSCAGVAHN